MSRPPHASGASEQGARLPLLGASPAPGYASSAIVAAALMGLAVLESAWPLGVRVAAPCLGTAVSLAAVSWLLRVIGRSGLYATDGGLELRRPNGEVTRVPRTDLARLEVRAGEVRAVDESGQVRMRVVRRAQWSQDALERFAVALGVPLSPGG